MSAARPLYYVAAVVRPRRPVRGALWFWTGSACIVAAIGFIALAAWLCLTRGMDFGHSAPLLLALGLLWASGKCAERATAYYEVALEQLDRAYLDKANQ